MMPDETQGSTSKLSFGNSNGNNESAAAVDTQQNEAVNTVPTPDEVQAATIQNEVENGQQTAPAPIPQAAGEAAAKVAGIDTNPKVDVKAPAVVGETEDVAALEEQRIALENRINEQRNAQKASVINQIKTVVDQYKIPLADLVEALGGLKKTRKSSGTVKPKYRNPDNHEQTWTGRGKAPLWIKDKDKNQFLITE